MLCVYLVELLHFEPTYILQFYSNIIIKTSFTNEIFNLATIEQYKARSDEGRWIQIQIKIVKKILKNTNSLKGIFFPLGTLGIRPV